MTKVLTTSETFLAFRPAINVIHSVDIGCSQLVQGFVWIIDTCTGQVNPFLVGVDIQKIRARVGYMIY